MQTNYRKYMNIYEAHKLYRFILKYIIDIYPLYPI